MDTQCVLCGGPVIREVEVAAGLYAGMCAYHLQGRPLSDDVIVDRDEPHL